MAGEPAFRREVTVTGRHEQRVDLPLVVHAEARLRAPGGETGRGSARSRAVGREPAAGSEPPLGRTDRL
jgi:hypothetical protein